MLRRLLSAGLALALLAFAGTAAAQARRPLTVAAGGEAAGWHPVVRLNGMLEDGALREALASGLPLRFRFRLELWEKQLFDRLRGTERASLALLQDPLEGSYALHRGSGEQRLFATLAEVEDALEGAFASALRPTDRGRYYYLAVLEVETLSLSDLEELQRWLRGEARPAVEGRRSLGRAVERGLRRAFVRVIGLPTRKYEARSQTFSPG